VEKLAKERGTVLGHVKNDDPNTYATVVVECTVICMGTPLLYGRLLHDMVVMRRHL
jgi:hypothetical protein